MARLIVALFALIRISTPQQTCLDRFCSSLAFPPSPTRSYASCTSSSSMCSIIAASALPGLHEMPLHHHLTTVWSSTCEGFALAAPPPRPPMLQTHSLSLFILYAFLLLKNSSGGMKCVKFGGWKSALRGVEKRQFGGWKCVKFRGWKCAGMK